MPQHLNTKSAPILRDGSSVLEMKRTKDSPPGWSSVHLPPDPDTLARVHEDLLHHTIPYRDLIFTEAEWSRHHSWKRYLPEPQVLGRLLGRLWPVIFWIFSICVACGIYQEFRAEHMPDLDMFEPTLVFNVCSFALSLLLVFKTNSCYARWVEARAAWGNVYHNIRSLVCKTQAFTVKMPKRHRLMFTRWVMAFPYVLRSHLLSYVPGSLALEPLLTHAECEWLLRRPHMPLAVVQMIGALLNTVDTQQPIVLANLHIELQQLVAQSTTCERLTRTPIPMAYTRHTVRFLLVYLSLLPLAMWSTLQWGTLLIVPMVAFLLMGIENIGNQIENPLLVLPMAGYCSKVHLDVLGITEDWVEGNEFDAERCFESLVNGKVPEWQEPHVAEEFLPIPTGIPEHSLDARLIPQDPALSGHRVAHQPPDLCHQVSMHDTRDDDALFACVEKQAARAIHNHRRQSMEGSQGKEYTQTLRNVV